MKDEPITVEDYKLVSDEFFQKYNFVAERLGVTKKSRRYSESHGSIKRCCHERTSQRKSRTFRI